jgi:hypothetical protein
MSALGSEGQVTGVEVAGGTLAAELIAEALA